MDAIRQPAGRRALVLLAEHAVPGAGPAGDRGHHAADLARPERRVAVALFALSYLGIAISLWPFIVPRTFTLWEATSSNSTQAFLLVGTLFLLPVILVYTAWSYWVFRGKVRADIGYH